MDSFNYSISQVISTGIIASLGAVAVAAKVYTTNIVFYVYVFGLSLGQASTLMIGWLVGAGEFDRAYRLSFRNLKLTVTLNAMLSALICLFRRPIVGIFTKDEEIIRLCSVILIVDIFVEIFRGVNHVKQNSLRGAGDARFPVIVSLCTCWGVSILFRSWESGRSTCRMLDGLCDGRSNPRKHSVRTLAFKKMDVYGCSE